MRQLLQIATILLQIAIVHIVLISSRLSLNTCISLTKGQQIFHVEYVKSLLPITTRP